MMKFTVGAIILWGVAIAALVMMLFLIPAPAETLPDAPSTVQDQQIRSYPGAPWAIIPPGRVQQPHSFFDAANSALLSADAALIGMNAFSTNLYVSRLRGHEFDPLARPFVTRGVAAQTAYWAGSFAAAAGTAYLFHRTGHHKWERITLALFTGAEGYAVGRNLRDFYKLPCR
jgi:hypothetical protein